MMRELSLCRAFRLYWFGIVVCWSLMLIIGSGCGSKSVAYESPYHAVFRDDFASLTMPSDHEIRSKGAKLQVPASIEKVWQACLTVASQYEGIVKLDRATEGSRRLVFIHGFVVPREIHYMMDKLVIRDMITTLIAVDVTGNDSDTVISSTWLLPETLKPTSFGHGATDDESSWKRTEKVMSKKDVTRLNQVAQMAEAVVYAFFRDVNTQLFAPNNWERKFGKIELSSVSIKGAAKTDYFARRKPEQVSFVPQTELERQYGNWISENVLRHMVVVRAPEFEQYVESVAMSILANAGVSGMRVRIRILSNAMVNAFSLSNGDIYLTAGLLDTLETIDELAIVLGHELGHMVHGDIHHSLEKRKSVRIARHAMMLAGTVAGGLAAAGIGTGGATIVTQSSSQTMTLSALKAVSTALGTVALCETTGWVSEEIYSIIFEGFSKESELQADAFAIRYVSAVGYAPKAAKSTLAKLSVAEEQLRAELDSSGVTTKIETSEKFIPALMGAKPGLQKRMEQIDKLLVEFQQKEKDLE